MAGNGTLSAQTVDIETARMRADYRNVKVAAKLLATAAGGLIIHDDVTDYWTFFNQEKMIRTRSVATVLMYILPLVGDVEMVG